MNAADQYNPPTDDSPRPTALRLGGVVLCGGQSSRMGFPKAMLPFGDQTLLERMIARLAAAGAAPIVVVAAPEQPLPTLTADVVVVRDENPGRGPLEGLRAGLSALADRADAAFATSCDAPFLEPRLVQSLAAMLEGYEIVVPDDGRFAHVLAAVYRVRVLPTIERLLAADRRRPLFLLEELPTRRVPVEQLRAVDPGLGSIRNLNEPDDYFAALADAGLEPPPEISERLRPS